MLSEEEERGEGEEGEGGRGVVNRVQRQSSMITVLHCSDVELDCMEEVGYYGILSLL